MSALHLHKAALQFAVHVGGGGSCSKSQVGRGIIRQKRSRDGKDVRRKEKTTLSFLFAEGEEKKVKVQNLK